MKRKGKLVNWLGVTAALTVALSSLTASAAEDSVYTTQRGDNLSKIAQKVYGDKARWREIYDANRGVISDPNKIWANQHLIVPGGTVEVPQIPEIPPQNMLTEWPALSEQWQAAKAVQQSYVEQNGLQLYQGTTCMTQGVRYDGNDPSNFDFIQVDKTILDVTIRDSEKEGYQVVTISNSSSGTTRSDEDGNRNYVKYPSAQLCDIYTGEILPNASTFDNAELVNTTDLTWGGIAYSIDYIKDVSWDWYDLTVYDDLYEQVGTCNVTQTITIPKGYDGLALIITPMTQGPASEEEYNTFDNTTKEYILDKWKEGTYLMRVSDLYNRLH
ncbi:MAG: LysM peptidoglycan-binding domain-containing protein [Lachnospiraceae bacterium]|nr:LysM peptidoglycan-binding domain-containing protein [Lachnospiraceae bacterium]